MAAIHEFPASAAKPLVEGYCQDFGSLAAGLAQTLEQLVMRGLAIEPCRDVLSRTERDLRGLADAIQDLLGRCAKRGTADAASAPPATIAPPPAQPGQHHQLEGISQSIPVLSVFQFLSRTRKSGTLHVAIDGEHLTFDFVAGLIEASSSDRNLEHERLGDLLLAMFPAQRERLEPVLQRSDHLQVRRLGAELVIKGLASNGQVVEALEKQVHARFHRVVHAAMCSYAFEEGERVPSDGRIRIRPFELEFVSKMQTK